MDQYYSLCTVFLSFYPLPLAVTTEYVDESASSQPATRNAAISTGTVSLWLIGDFPTKNYADVCTRYNYNHRQVNNVKPTPSKPRAATGSNASNANKQQQQTKTILADNNNSNSNKEEE